MGRLEAGVGRVWAQKGEKVPGWCSGNELQGHPARLTVSLRREVWGGSTGGGQVGGQCGRQQSSFEPSGHQSHLEKALCLCEVCDFSGSGRTCWAGCVGSSREGRWLGLGQVCIPEGSEGA